MTQLAPAPVPPQNMASTAALLSEWPRIKFQPAGDRNKFWTVCLKQAANSINSWPVPFPDQKQELARVAWGGVHFRINGRGGIKLSFTAGLSPFFLLLCRDMLGSPAVWCAEHVSNNSLWRWRSGSVGMKVRAMHLWNMSKQPNIAKHTAFYNCLLSTRCCPTRATPHPARPRSFLRLSCSARCLEALQERGDRCWFSRT